MRSGCGSGACLVGSVEQDIMRGLASGDQRSFARLVTLHGARVQAIARQFLGNHADAEDVMQEVFVKAWRASTTFDPSRASLSTWLYRITTNSCLDRLRRGKRWRWLGIEHIAEQADEALPSDEAIGQRQTVAAVRRDIRQLPERQRLALLLVSVGECSAQEVADVMNISKGGAEQLIVRARQFLRQRQRERDGHGQK